MKITIDLTSDNLDTDENRTCEILSVGDTAMAGLSLTPEQNFENIFSDDVLSILHDKDISCVNLECPLTTVDDPIVKNGPNLSAPPETVDLLTAGGFDIAVMANNHILDQGPAGLEETLSLCHGAGIKTVGVGSDLQSAYRPLIVEVKGIKIAFLAFAEEEFACATETTAGAAKLDPVNAATVIREAKTKSDLVVVNVHGGNEYCPFVSPRVQSWYRFFADCGAAAVIGHHTHCVQGMEIHNGTPVLYSLGNFLFPPVNPELRCWNEGLVLRLKANGHGVTDFELRACRQIEKAGRMQVDLLDENQESSFFEKWKRLCEIAGDVSLTNGFWKCFCDSRRDHYLNVLKMATNGYGGNAMQLLKSAVKSGDISYLLCICSDYLNYLLQKKSSRNRRIVALKNFLRCPAHHEALSTVVEMEMTGERPSQEFQREFDDFMNCWVRTNGG